MKTLPLLPLLIATFSLPTYSQDVASVYTVFDTQSEKVLNDYPSFETRYKELRIAESNLTPVTRALNKAVLAKDPDEAEIAILKTREKTLNLKFKETMEAFFKPNPLSALAWVTFVQKAPKTEITKENLKKAFASFKASGLSSGLPPSSCINDKLELSIEKSCITSALKLCNSDFSSEGEKLVQPFLDEELEVQVKPLTRFEDWMPDTKPDGDDAFLYESGKMIALAAFNLCTDLAKKGISLNRKGIDFKGSTEPSWVAAISFKMAFLTPESIDEKCLGKAGVPKDLRSKLARLKGSYKLPYSLGSVEKGINNCQGAIADLCSPAYKIKETTVYSYPTKACQIREVTAQDIENDIKNWKQAGMEEAMILAHSTLLDIVRTCEQAREYGYSWRHILPRMDSSCNKGNKSKR